MPVKALYFDVETTGRSAYKNDIVQLSGMIEIDGIVKEEFNLLAKPADPSTIEDEALQVIGKTRDEIMQYPDRSEMKKKFQEMLGRYVNKFDKNDKFIPVGYNVRFDLDFIHSFFKKQRDQYLGSYISWYYVDVMALANLKAFEGAFSLENHKLATLCGHYGIEINAHDAMSDILATRELLFKMLGREFRPTKPEAGMTVTPKPVQQPTSEEIADDIPF